MQSQKIISIVVEKLSNRKLLTLICVLFLGLIVIYATGNGDFKVFLEAAKLVRDGQSPYHFWIKTGEGVYCLYYYSPFFSLILIPFSFLPNFIPNLIWLLLNVFFLIRSWVLTNRYLDTEKLTQFHRKLLVIMALLFTFRFIQLNFAMIQLTIYILWSILESLSELNKKRYLTGGLLLALAINIKIMPLVLIPYLLYRRQFSGVASTLVFLVFFLVIPSLFIGYGFNYVLHDQWWQIINPVIQENTIEAGLGMHSLTALVPALLLHTSGELEIKRNFVALDSSAVFIILNSIRTFLMVSVLYFLRTLPFRRAQSKHHQLWEISYIVLLIPLIFPHQQKYAFLLVLPAVIYIFFFLFTFKAITPSDRKRVILIRFLLLLAFLLITMTTDGLIGRELSKISQHFKLITFGTIILGVVLTLCNADKIPSDKDQASVV